MEPLRWNEAKPKDHRTKHENQACLVADKGLDVANYSRASGGGRKMFLTSPLIDQGDKLAENWADFRSKRVIEIFRQLGNQQIGTIKLAQCQFGFLRHASGGNATVFVWRGPLRSGVCCPLKGRRRGTVPTCHPRSLSPQSLEADTSTIPT